MSSRHKGMGRREFLTTSACALATAAVGRDLFAALAGQPRLVVAGFAPLEIESAGTDAAFERNVIAAERVARSDSAFRTRGAQVSTHGMSGGDPRASRALHFMTHYTYRDGGEERVAPFHVWGGMNSPVRFTVPVDQDLRIRFSVTAPMPVPAAAPATTRRALAFRDASAPKTAPTALPIELSLDGAMRLTRGFYVIVPVYDGQSAPNWSSYSLRRAGSRWTLHTSDGEAVRFEHFVVRIDYPTPRTRAREARA